MQTFHSIQLLNIQLMHIYVLKLLISLITVIYKRIGTFWYITQSTFQKIYGLGKVKRKIKWPGRIEKTQIQQKTLKKLISGFTHLIKLSNKFLKLYHKKCKRNRFLTFLYSFNFSGYFPQILTLLYYISLIGCQRYRFLMNGAIHLFFLVAIY